MSKIFWKAQQTQCQALTQYDFCCMNLKIKTKCWDDKNQMLKEGNKGTYNRVKKRWHIYCYINVIYILCFLLQTQKKRKGFEFLLLVFWCALTIPWILTWVQIIHQPTMTGDRAGELWIWNIELVQYPIRPRLRATILLMFLRCYR